MARSRQASLPTTLLESIEATNLSVRVPDTSVVDAGVFAVEEGYSGFTGPSHLETASPHHEDRMTSLDAVSSSPDQSAYQGYGHIQRSHVYPKPTTPTAASKPPIQSTNACDSLANSISFYSPPSSSFNDTSPPTQSPYQGYTYHTYPNCRTLPYTLGIPPQQGVLPFGMEYVSEQPYYSQAPAFSPMGSHPPLTPSATPLNSSTKESTDNSSGFLDSTNGSTSTANTLPNHLESPHLTTSGSTEEFDNTPPLSTKATIHLPSETLKRDHAFETWRTATLENLETMLPNTSPAESSLAIYVLQHFNTDNTYTDCCLQVTHKNHRFKGTEIWLHRILVAQSPTLRTLLDRSEAGAGGKSAICLEVDDRYSTLGAINSALRVCYGESPLSFTGYEAHIEPSRSNSDVLVSWMNDALAFTAAGRLLQLPLVITRGIQIVSAILNWDTIERVLSFSLDFGLDRIFDELPSIPPPTNNDDVSSPSNTISTAEFIPSSATLDVTGDSKWQNSFPDPFEDLLYKCLDFILTSFPSSWNTHESARPLADCDRLPTVKENRSPMSKSRLSRIQFGDHPPENAVNSDDHNIVLSSIVLSLPFTTLRYILDHVEEPIRRRNIRIIIAERERRRQRVLKSEDFSAAQKDTATEELAEVGWKEFALTEGISDHSIARVWTGF